MATFLACKLGQELRDSYPESKIKAISIQNANVTGPQFFNLFHRTEKNRMQIISKVVTEVVIGLSEPSIDGYLEEYLFWQEVKNI